MLEKNYQSLASLMHHSEEEQRKTNEEVLAQELAIQEKKNEGLQQRALTEAQSAKER